MLARVQSYLLQGIDALPCEVEVDFELEEYTDHTVVGLPDASVKESIERMNSALVNSGYPFPKGRMLVNLAPADVRKEGPMYDLPIAVGYLVTQGIVTGARAQASLKDKTLLRRANEAGGESGLDLRQFLFAAELALDGRLRPIKGAIAMAALAAEQGLRGVVIPAENAAEAAVVPGVEVIGARTLSEVVGILNGQIEAAPHPAADVEGLLKTATAPVDFAEIRGQEAVKRAIVIAAAGSHNILGLCPRARSARRPQRTDGHNLFGLWVSDRNGGGTRVGVGAPERGRSPPGAGSRLWRGVTDALAETRGRFGLRLGRFGHPEAVAATTRGKSRHDGGFRRSGGDPARSAALSVLKAILGVRRQPPRLLSPHRGQPSQTLALSG